MKQAHDNWATFYDFVYEKTFGSFYYDLTAETLILINDILPNGSIIDFGAGTGRLSFPLLKEGYSVVAVEKSKGMVEEFKRKRDHLNLDLEIHHCSISDYKSIKADLALAMFTVLNYSITEEELSANIENICKHLNLNGYFLFDIPSLELLDEEYLTNVQSEHFNRIVELININDDIYTYKEASNGIFKNEKFNYKDEFSIRYWSLYVLDNLLKDHELYDTQKDFSYFNSTGSTYKLYQKR